SPLAASEIAPLAKPKYHGQKTEMVCTIGYRVVLAADGAHANPSDRENTRLDRSLADKLEDLTHVDAFIQIARILNREMRHLQTPNKSSASSGEVTAHGPILSIVGLNRVAFAGLDRTDEGAGQHHLTGLERQSVRRDLVGKPRHAGG